VEIIARLRRVVREFAWKAQVGLCARYRRVRAQAKKPTIVVAAIARGSSPASFGPSAAR
jgi:transposase